MSPSLRHLVLLGAFLGMGAFALAQENGWQLDYFRNTELGGEPVARTSHPGSDIDLEWGRKAPVPGLQAVNYSSRLSRLLSLDEPAICTFILEADDGARLLVDDKTGIEWWGAESRTDTRSYTTTLAMGDHTLVVEHYQLGGTAHLRLKMWIRPLSQSHAGRVPPPATKARSWYKGDLHAHSTVSDGNASVADMVKNAEDHNLDFFVLSDHNTERQWADPAYVSDKLTLLYGFEWTINQGMSGTGHANIWSNLPFEYPLFAATLGSPSLEERYSSDVPSAVSLVRALAKADQELLFSFNHPLSTPYDWKYSLALSHGQAPHHGERY